MDKKIAGLLGAAVALTSVTTAQAAALAAPSATPTSYRDLLDPVSNALPQLKADDARRVQTKTILADETVIIKKKDRHHHHHHHHHHHPA